MQMKDPTTVQLLSVPRAEGGRIAGSFIDRMVHRLLSKRLESACVGTLTVELPSGHQATFGNGRQEFAPRLVLKNYSVFWKMALRGPLGFAESFIAGDVATDDLSGVFNFFVDNEQPLAKTSAEFIESGWLDRAYHRLRANTRSGSKRNIAAHYDLGNAFYKLWLDAGLTYSSAIFPTPFSTLEQGQAAKYDAVIDGLQLAPGHRVLEIGCGWGGFAEAAARRGASVDGITISREQFEASRARISAADLTDHVDIRLQDYRDTLGHYDRIASIEMIEAVGEDNWAQYFGVIADRLKPGGIAVIQAITIRGDLYANYRRNPDFIQRYVFPGGMLPTDAAMQRHANAASLTFEPLQMFGASYARTLSAWRENFHAAWPQIQQLGFDEQFRRLWEYYLVYCQVGFERGSVQVGHYRLTKPR
jgi:cyclopropane-fatty-acyl-phospholipid synthase